jgi:arylsulfatase A-like enzyme
MVGHIFDGLAAQHLPDGTVVIVVADHGESFAEHRTLLHGRRLYDELLRVPFLVHAGGRLGAPRVVRGAVGLVDVVPTVLELAGLAPASGLDGVGLVAATAAPAGLADRAMRAYDERRRFVDGVERVELLEAVRTPRAKAIVRRDAANRRIIAADVFDLGADAAEAHSIPFNAFDRPCGFGESFARALKDVGLPMPCLDK